MNHPTAEVRAYTRMHVRVLDHRRLLESLHLPEGKAGGLTVAVHETEGHVSRLRVEFEAGRATVTPLVAPGGADFACRDLTWAAVACGDLPATAAVELGLADCPDRSAAAVLDALSYGRAPFCGEYF